MARTFTTASSEYVGFTPRAWDTWNGITIAAQLRRNTTAVFHTIYYSGANGGAVNGQIQLGLDSSDDMYFGIGGTSTTIATTITAAAWCLGASKATGSSIPVSHRATTPFSTWTHANMAAALADPATTAQTLEEIGRWNGASDYFGGDIEWVGIWGFNMGNNEFESLFRVSPALIPNLYPFCQRFWWFNQPASDNVRDLSNHMADQTARTGTSLSNIATGVWNFGAGRPIAAMLPLGQVA